MGRYALIIRPVRRVIDALMSRAALYGSPSFFEPRLFPWVRELERHWEAVRTELEPILKDKAKIPNFQDVSNEKNLSDDDRWKVFSLVHAEIPVDENCKRLPKTMSLLSQIPGAYNVVLSILGPSKHVPKHRGQYPALLRYQLGLIVPGPEGASGIDVDGDVRYWKEGRSLIWDRSKRHSAWNDADQDRVTLYVDFIRPMHFPMQAIAWALLKYLPRVVFGPR